MALQSSGQITIQDIVNEFGGDAPHGLKEYYSAAAGIPASGEISIKDFYEASAGTSYTMFVGRPGIDFGKGCSLLDIFGVSQASSPGCGVQGTLSPSTLNGATVQTMASSGAPSSNGFLIELIGNRAKNFFSSITIDGVTLYTADLTDYGTDPGSVPTGTNARYYRTSSNLTVYSWVSSAQTVPYLGDNVSTNIPVTTT